MIAVIVMLLSFFGVAVFKWRRRRMYELASKIPGQPMLPVVGHLFQFAGTTEDIMTALMRTSYFAMKAGGVAKLWGFFLLYIMLVDPVDIEYVLRTCLEKDDLHRFIREILGNGIIFAPVNIWRRRRKILLPAFSPKILDGFVDVFSEQSQQLVKSLKKKANLDTFEVWPFVNSYSMDSVSEAVTGIKTNAQNDSKSTFLIAVNNIMHLVAERIFHIWLHCKWTYPLMPHFWKHRTAKSVLFAFTDNIINTKSEEFRKRNMCETETEIEIHQKRRTYLELLISISGKDKSYDRVELREEILSLTIAGTDTTAIVMGFVLMMLGKHHNVQEKVLLDIYGNSKRALVKEDLSKMVYLEQVIKESMRLYPPAPFAVRKVEKEVTLPSGITVPVGACIPISIWGVHRYPKYWGSDAEEFNPGRFSPEMCKLRHPCVYMPFSQGPRNCIGHQFAMMSLKTSISTILRNYEVMVTGENLTSKYIRVKLDFTLKAADGFMIQLKPRK